MPTGQEGQIIPLFLHPQHIHCVFALHENGLFGSGIRGWRRVLKASLKVCCTHKQISHGERLEHHRVGPGTHNQCLGMNLALQFIWVGQTYPLLKPG